MEEKIMIEFTGEQMDKILEYQKVMEKFKATQNKTVQELIMMAIDRQLFDPRIVI